MTYAIVDAASFEGRRKLIAQELGARAIRLNRVDSKPAQAGKGRFVLVTPDETRQVVAGPEGLSYVVVGAVVGTR